MNKDIKKWWESHRLLFNIYTIITGVLCMVLMKFFNSASVNFFMLPFGVFYLSCLNIVYTLFYVINYRHAVDNSSGLNARAFNKIVVCVVLANILLGIYCIVSITHH
ncbi:hypothetical protein SAMN04488505_11040 [Chitinophaga rupis]|uniref:Uncharacterized protein n=1 Tax=Chitinophaga rupis TaxID=573321 RepID=A0A1H8G4V4_9BACT|nr:hypothetical protein SAMN04488505_11040 [Chitinophaga rupis]